MRFGVGNVACTALLALFGVASRAQEAPPRPNETGPETHERMSALSPFSKVTPPEGIEVKPKSFAESPGNYREWNALARGTTSPRSLLDHYSAELGSAGWTFRPVVDEDPVVFRTGEHLDAEGVRWHVLLLSAPSHRETGACTLTFRLTQLTPGAATPAP